MVFNVDGPVDVDDWWWCDCGNNGLYEANSVPSTRCRDESKTFRFFVFIFSHIPMCLANESGTKVREHIGHFSNSSFTFVDGTISNVSINFSNSIVSGSGVCNPARKKKKKIKINFYF